MDIIEKLDRYRRLREEADRLDLYLATGTPHDVSAYLGARYELPVLEAELIEAGIFKASAGDVVSWARRKI